MKNGQREVVEFAKAHGFEFVRMTHHMAALMRHKVTGARVTITATPRAQRDRRDSPQGQESAAMTKTEDLRALWHKETALTPEERQRLGLHRGQANGRRGRIATPAGYAAIPGTGPAGETCKTCGNLVRRELAKTYLKCALTPHTGGSKTDVRAKSPACKYWKLQEPTT